MIDIRHMFFLIFMRLFPTTQLTFTTCSDNNLCAQVLSQLLSLYFYGRSMTMLIPLYKTNKLLAENKMQSCCRRGRTVRQRKTYT